jgi:hypothetical protein
MNTQHDPVTPMPIHDPGHEHRGHGWMMIACCIPMLVIAIALVETGASASWCSPRGPCRSPRPRALQAVALALLEEHIASCVVDAARDGGKPDPAARTPPDNHLAIRETL